MAIDDDLGAVGSREPAPKVLVATLQQHLERQVERTGNVALAGVARSTERTVKFLRGANVDEHELPPPAHELLELDLPHARPRAGEPKRHG